MTSWSEKNFLERLMPQLKSRRDGDDKYCPGAKTIVAASEGRLSGPLRTAVDQHILVCQACADLYGRSRAFHRAQENVPPAEWRQAEQNLDHWIDGFLASQPGKAKAVAKPPKPYRVVGWKEPRHGFAWPWALALAAMLLLALGGIIAEKYRSELGPSETSARAGKPSVPVNPATRQNPALPIIAPPASNGSAGSANANGQEQVAGNNPPSLGQPAAKQIPATPAGGSESQPAGTPAAPAPQTQVAQAPPAEPPPPASATANGNAGTTVQGQTPPDQQPSAAANQAAPSTPSSAAGNAPAANETAQSAAAPGQAPRTEAPPVDQRPAVVAQANRSALAPAGSNTPYRTGSSSMRASAPLSRNSAAMNRPGAVGQPSGYSVREGGAAASQAPVPPESVAGASASALPASFQIAGGTRVFIRLKSVNRRADGFYTFNGKLLLDLNQNGATLLDRNSDVYGFVTSNGNKVSLSVAGFVVNGTRYSLTGPLAAAHPEEPGGRAIRLNGGQDVETWLGENSIFQRTDAGAARPSSQY
jgi:hypothetical protein